MKTSSWVMKTEVQWEKRLRWLEPRGRITAEQRLGKQRRTRDFGTRWTVRVWPFDRHAHWEKRRYFYKRKPSYLSLSLYLSMLAWGLPVLLYFHPSTLQNKLVNKVSESTLRTWQHKEETSISVTLNSYMLMWCGNNIQWHHNYVVMWHNFDAACFSLWCLVLIFEKKHTRSSATKKVVLMAQYVWFKMESGTS